MTDKKLLDDAAKAAGLKYAIYVECVEDWDSEHKGGPALQIGSCKAQTWNPITNDGDALRLAVKLDLFVDTYGQMTTVGRVVDTNSLACVTLEEPHNGDPLAATRRAIVRAAAEIGEAMP